MNADQQPGCIPEAKKMMARYQCAQTLMQGLRTQRVVKNDNLLPHWIAQTNYFWYERTHKTGKEYRLVNAQTLVNKLAFDHTSLAGALSKAVNQKVNAQDLPITSVTISLSPLKIVFTSFDRHWQFEADSETCRALEIDAVETVPSNQVVSPNGKQIAFVRNNNLWVRDIISGEERALTQDGETFYAYAAPGSAYGVSWAGLNVQWSPDSQKLFTVQLDRRKVNTLPMVDHLPKNGQLRPTVEHIKVAYPGDDNVEEYRLLSIEVANRRACEANYRRIPVSSSDFGFFIPSQLAWWANDSTRAYFIDQTRGEQELRLVEFDTNTGATHILFEEFSDTRINVKPEIMDLPLHINLPETNELIWWSERSGWGHLYLYDLDTGTLKHPITNGDWRVRDILHVDVANRELVIQTAGRTHGRNPYYRDICRVQIDTGELTTLLSTDHEYVVHSQKENDARRAVGYTAEDTSGVAPNKNYVVATQTRADQVPITLLLDRDGKILTELETADIAGLPDGWQWPEPVKLMAADGKTDIYGLLFRPSSFLEGKQYPVINMIVSGPWFSAVPHGSFHNSRGYADRYYFQAAALAELGFMVVIIDSRGTPLRDKAFQDTSYGWIPSSANSADHRNGIEQLANRYPEMDLNRVGVYSPTGYQGGIQNLLECSDFYQVGVINTLQDSRFIGCTAEGDSYQGVSGPMENKRFPEQLVQDWDGKLLLIHAMYGGFAACYPPAPMFRLIEALRKANKDFDLLVMPHFEGILCSYEVRRTWDYLVRHLQGAEPPREFKLGEFLC